MLKHYLLIASFVLCFCSKAAAQDSSVEINLLDQNKALVSAFSVNLKNEKGRIVQEKTSKKPQPVTFSGISAGEYFIEINAAGFKSVTERITIKTGRNSANFVLNVAEIVAEVKVEQSAQEKNFDQAISKNYTLEEIEALPDTPDDIKKEFQRKYGDDVVIRVNGFKSNQMPPKEQIAAIKVIRSSFDAEFHEVGLTVVDVTTKAGGDKFFGFLKFDGNTYKLNARNAFSPRRLPQQNTTLTTFLLFPTYKKKTSVSALLVATQSGKGNNLVGFNPDIGKEPETESARRSFLPSVIVAHNLSKNHVLNLTYALLKTKTTNLGVGGFDLSERAYTTKSTNHLLQVSETGVVKNKFSNQFRLEIGATNSATIPVNQTPAIVVSGRFSQGGASVNNKLTGYAANLTDIIFFDYKKHSLKFGVQAQYEQQKTDSSDNLNGTFTFLNFADYKNNKPFSYAQRRSATAISLSQIQLAAFVQDDFRLRKNLQLGIGLRYERQNNLKDGDNFSPRLSLVWSPDKEAKFVVRSGAGIFYQWLDTAPLSTVLSNDGRRGSDLFIINPGYPNPLIGGGAAGISRLPSIMRIDDELESPSSFINKTGLNYRISSKLNLETTYTFRRSVHQFRSRDINAPLNGQRPNSEFVRIAQVESSGNSAEDSLELKLDATLKKDFFFDASYKLGKITSNYDDIFALPSDSYNVELDRSYSNLDQRHRFNARLVFPSWRKFSLNTTFRLESARPYSITTGFDNNGDGVLNDRPPGGARNGERGDWFRQVDANLSWKTKFGESDEKNPASKLKNRVVFNVAVKNLFNQTNKQNFVGIQTSPFFGQATAASPARAIQAGLVYMF